jgi:hypothetical protein
MQETRIPLATSFRSRGWEFTQIAREGKIAMFSKTKSDFETYEVIIIQEHEEHQWPKGDITPAHESYPGDETWGKYGWSLTTKDRAWEKFNELKRR